MGICTCSWSVEVCPECNGTRKVSGKICSACEGRGTGTAVVLAWLDPGCPKHGSYDRKRDTGEGAKK